MKVTTMKKLHVLAATAGILLALAGPSLAASRTHGHANTADVNTVRTYGDRDYRNPPSGREVGMNAYARGGYDQYQYGPSQNLPYPDRPYGDPDSW
jgi:hypothetical protein